MIVNPKDQITTIQTTAMVSKSMIGTGILILPRAIAKEVGTPDGWISVILSGLIALLAGYIIVKLSQRFPNQTFYQYSQIVVGPLLGKFFGIVMSVYFILCAGYLLRVMGEVIRMFLLEKTPLEVIMIIFLFVATYLTVAGINPIARLVELFLPIIIIILIAFIVFSSQSFELDNMRPVLGDGVMPVLKGTKSSIFTYSGFEVMLVLTAFMKEPQKAVKSAIAGISLVVLLYGLVIVISFGTISVDELKTVIWPTMTVAKDIELPGGFFERFESLFTVLWVISMYTAFVLYQYTSSLGLSQIFRKKHQTFVYASLPIIYLVAMFPADLNDVFKFGDILGWTLSLFVAGIMPPCFWLIAKIRRKGIEKS
ncbi:germination protein BB [Paenibacillus baekrokdamisoli]|uniref:Germination protein BB n=1 Tax=Paenibacillus baekrokdamisoli TaxID=1712516 RepID=A0A3G9J1V2_9BACL|nr:spore germination protein [Paenibacillus baekrokdamisoli]MBB3072583.1 spore germination protein [Paenibacillus baekrokdamisoli]BBH22365.1 germination protein BB [Paenibacillus baekrokdamisoli]